MMLVSGISIQSFCSSLFRLLRGQAQSLNTNHCVCLFEVQKEFHGEVKSGWSAKNGVPFLYNASFH